MTRSPHGRGTASAARELRILIPNAPVADRPPEQACALMQTELDALALDIDAARELARRVAVTGLDFHRGRRRAPKECERVNLARGPAVVIRPIEPGDAHELARCFHRLGALSRFRRFLFALDHLSPRQVEYLTRIDHATHEALIALDAETGDGLGVARYVRDPDDPRVARFSAVVVDSAQGRGLGKALLDRLAERAHDNGVEVLAGSTVAGNRAARRLGASSTLDARTGTLQLTLGPGTKPHDHEAAPSTFEAAAVHADAHPLGSRSPSAA